MPKLLARAAEAVTTALGTALVRRRNNAISDALILLVAVPASDQTQQVIVTLLECGNITSKLRSLYRHCSLPVSGRRDRASPRRSIAAAQVPYFLGRDTRGYGQLAGSDGGLRRSDRFGTGLGRSSRRCAVLNMLGLLLLHASQSADALACFERIPELLPADDPRANELILAANTNTALAALKVRDITKAYRAAHHDAAKFAAPRCKRSPFALRSGERLCPRTSRSRRP